MKFLEEGRPTIGGPSGKSVPRVYLDPIDGEIYFTTQGKKDSRLSPSQARSLAASLLRAAGEESLAVTVPWNNSRTMRIEAAEIIVRLGRRIEKELRRVGNGN